MCGTQHWHGGAAEKGGDGTLVPGLVRGRVREVVVTQQAPRKAGPGVGPGGDGAGLTRHPGLGLQGRPAKLALQVSTCLYLSVSLPRPQYNPKIYAFYHKLLMRRYTYNSFPGTRSQIVRQ